MSFVPLVAPAAALLAWLLVALARRAALRWYLLDHPNARSSHTVPTPRLGGLGLAVVLLGGLLVAPAWLGNASAAQACRVLAGAGLLVALVSLVDDIRPMPVAIRLGVHLVVGALVLMAAGPLRSLVIGGGELPLASWVGGAVLVLWIAGFVNAFNFMDGIDGIAGGQALVAGVGWIVLGAVGDAPALMYAGWLVVGASCGFLVHNWSPASIFMGDAGSALLGFLLAAGPLLLAGPAFWWPGLLLVWPFVFDTFVTLVRRLLRGEPVWKAHRTHLYQRLAGPGASHRTVALLYMALAVLGGVAAVASVQRQLGWMLAALALIAAAAFGLWRTVEHRERKAGLTLRPEGLT